MTTAYTSLLGLALPVTGELSGTWGDTVNTAITSLLDTAIAGTTSITTDADITLSTTTGASNQARQAIILWNPASGTVTRNITAPAQSKMYVVINASGGTQSIVIRGAGPTTGVTIAKGESATVAWNGSDFVKVSSSGGAITFTDLTVTGNTILGDAAADTLTVNATSTFASPVSFQNLVRLPSTGRSAAAALTITAPAFLYGVASTYTDTTSSGTIAAMAPFYSIAAPTLATSNVTTYSFASTLYLAGAPAAGGSATITNPYALYVNSGANYFGGNSTFAANVTLGDAAADNITVNGTITSNLIFTDDTYDIGATGATRPRYIYSTNNHIIQKALDPLFQAVANTSTTTAGLTSSIDNNAATWFAGTRGDSVGGTSGTQRWNLLYNSTSILYASSGGLVGVGQTPIDKLTVSGAVVSTGSTVLNSSNTAAIFDWDTSTSEGRLLAARSTGSMIGLWTNTSGGALLRRVYIDGLGRAKFGTDNSSGTSAPQAWATTQSVIELGGGGIWNASNTVGGTMSLTSNAYFDTTNAWLRRASGYAARIDALGLDGSVAFQTASATSTAGSAITWDNSLTLNNANQLLLTTTNATNGAGIFLSTPNTAQYSVVQLANTGTSGRAYQIGVAGNTASPANQLYLYDSTAGLIRFAINPSGQVGIGLTTQSSLLHMYNSGANVTLTIESGGTSDAGVLSKTSLGAYKFGTGIGTATNSFTIYDVGGGSAQRFRIDGSGFTTVGTSVSAIAKLAVQVGSSDGNLGSWGDGQFVVTRGGDGYGNGLGISYSDANVSSYLTSLAPGAAWRDLGYRAKNHNFYTEGTTLAATIDQPFSQLVVQNRHAFFAHQCQATNQPSGTVLIFATAPTNQGSRYSTVNGRFTAAVAGIYLFSHTALTFNITNYFYGTLQINGVDKQAIWHSPQNPGTAADYQEYSWSATVYLSVGDYVTVATKYNGGAPYVEGNRSTFSGHLVG
jgi:hypothetical protein